MKNFLRISPLSLTSLVPMRRALSRTVMENCFSLDARSSCPIMATVAKVLSETFSSSSCFSWGCRVSEVKISSMLTFFGIEQRDHIENISKSRPESV